MPAVFSDLINHQAWHCTASFRALIVIGVAAAFGAVCTQSSAFGLRQREGHRAAALPALFMNRSKEAYRSSRQCGLDDNGVRFTAVKEVDVSISLRLGFVGAQVGGHIQSVSHYHTPSREHMAHTIIGIEPYGGYIDNSVSSVVIQPQHQPHSNPNEPQN